MQATRLLTVLVVLGLIVGAIPGGALAAAAAPGDATTGPNEATTERIDVSTVSAQTDGGNESETETDDESGADDGSSRAAVGQQLATVISVTDDEVTGEVEASSLDAALEAANESERAVILADRAATLRDRADTLVTDHREARGAYEDGDLTREGFAQRLAVQSGQAATIDRGFARLDDRAENVSALELRAAGYDRSANEATRERLSRVTGSGTNALLAQYTGEQSGEFSLEIGDGVSIEVESDDGERSREVEREQPGNGTFQVTQSDALAAATEPLSSDVDGEWRLRSADREEEYGYYEFEFAFSGPEMTGEAEVSVDGETGGVFELEEEFESREAAESEDDDAEDEDAEDGDGDDEGDETPLAISIANGTAAPGETITLRVTADGEPVEGAIVEFADRDAGETDADGRIMVTLPNDEEVEFEVEDGEREGELELTLRSSSAEDEDETLRERLSVTGSVDGGTVTVSVRYDGEGVSGVSVTADGESVGTTGENGSLSFDAPATDDGELDVTLIKGSFEAELEFEIGDDGGLTLTAVAIEDGEEERADAEEDEDAEDEQEDAEGDEEAEDDEEPEESADDGDGGDAENRADADADDLSLAVVSGNPGPGATVTVEVADVDGEPVEDATVSVEGDSAGETDATGQIIVTLPEADDVDLSAAKDDSEGELELDLTENDDTGSEDDDTGSEDDDAEDDE